MKSSKSFPSISATEWEIMQVLWHQETPLTAAEIFDELKARDGSWHPKTAQTLIGRLIQKGALELAGKGRPYRYKPLVSRAECVDRESHSFLERIFNGSLQPMLAHFVEQKKLSQKEIRNLKEILEGGKK